MKINSGSLEIFSARKLGGNAKATVHPSGRISFSKSAEDMLGLTKESAIVFGKMPSESGYESLFGIISTKADGDAFSVSYSGGALQVNVKNLLDQLNVDYKKMALVYNVFTVEDEKNKQVFRLALRKETSRIKRTRAA